MLAVVSVLLVAGPVFMVRCLAGVDVAVDGLDVVGMMLQIISGRLLKGVLAMKCTVVGFRCFLVIYQKYSVTSINCV